MVRALINMMKPTHGELERFALRETDPRFYHEFVPYTRGPVFSIVMIIATLLAAAVVAPFRILSAALKADR